MRWQDKVAPSRGRGLKPKSRFQGLISLSRPFTGAWIETPIQPTTGVASGVAPSRGRGLKPSWTRCSLTAPWSPLHGGVD